MCAWECVCADDEQYCDCGDIDPTCECDPNEVADCDDYDVCDYEFDELRDDIK